MKDTNTLNYTKTLRHVRNLVSGRRTTAVSRTPTPHWLTDKLGKRITKLKDVTNSLALPARLRWQHRSN